MREIKEAAKEESKALRDKGLVLSAERSISVQAPITLQEFKNYIWPSKMDRPPTDREAVLYASKWQRLEANPYTGDVVLVPFKTKEGSMTLTEIFSKEYFLKRAFSFPEYEGFKAGIVVWNPYDKKREYFEGEILPTGWLLIGGWCEVYVHGSTPIRSEVSFERYKKEFKPQWKDIPETMIRKVAIVHALREAFPRQFDGARDEFEHEDGQSPEVIQPVEAAETTFARLSPPPEVAPVAGVASNFQAVSQGQLAKLFALVNEKNLDTEKTKRFLYEKYSVASSKELSSQQASEVIEFLIQGDTVPLSKQVDAKAVIPETTPQESAKEPDAFLEQNPDLVSGAIHGAWDKYAAFCKEHGIDAHAYCKVMMGDDDLKTLNVGKLDFLYESVKVEAQKKKMKKGKPVEAVQGGLLDGGQS